MHASSTPLKVHPCLLEALQTRSKGAKEAACTLVLNFIGVHSYLRCAGKLGGRECSVCYSPPPGLECDKVGLGEIRNKQEGHLNLRFGTSTR
eukprot:scaffold106_cov380-Prasinococcus_capsulatus_cf.AAC.25